MQRSMRMMPAMAAGVFLGMLLNTGCALATTVTLWPDQFRIDNWDVNLPPTRQDPDTLRGNAHYFAELDIPAGSTVQYLRVNYNNPPASGYDFCLYFRRKAPAALAETLIDYNAPTPLPEGDALSVKSGPADVRGPLTIRRGYRYYLQFEPNEFGSLNSIQIVY